MSFLVKRIPIFPLPAVRLPGWKCGTPLGKPLQGFLTPFKMSFPSFPQRVVRHFVSWKVMAKCQPATERLLHCPGFIGAIFLSPHSPPSSPTHAVECEHWGFCGGGGGPFCLHVAKVPQAAWQVNGISINICQINIQQAKTEDRA